MFRVQRLAEAPDPAVITQGLPGTAPLIGTEELGCLGPTVETVYDNDLTIVSHAVEITYTGSYELDEKTLEDGSAWMNTLERSEGGSPQPSFALATCPFRSNQQSSPNSIDTESHDPRRKRD